MSRDQIDDKFKNKYKTNTEIQLLTGFRQSKIKTDEELFSNSKYTSWSSTSDYSRGDLSVTYKR